MKKFLTVLLALSVVFTYTVGTAFADVDTTTAADAQEAMEEAVNTYYASNFAYNTNGYLVSVAGATTNVDTNLTKTVVDAAIAQLISDYKTKITEADVLGSDVTTAWTADLNADASKLFTALVGSDGVKNYAATDGVIYTAAVSAAKTAATNYMNSIDTSLYSTADASTINTAKVTLSNAINAAVNSKAGLGTLLSAQATFKGVVDSKTPVANQASELAKYKTASQNAVSTAAAAFLIDEQTRLDGVNTSGMTVAELTEHQAKINNLSANVAAVEALYNDQISAVTLDSQSLDEAKNAIGGIVDEAIAAFSTDSASAGFYAVVNGLSDAKVLVTYAESYATSMKNQYDPATGLAVYNAATVDSYLADTIAKINALQLTSYAAVAAALEATPKATAEASALATYRTEAIKVITTDTGSENTDKVSGTSLSALTGDFAKGNWDADYQDEIEAIQKDYTKKINAATTKEDIIALVKEAQAAMENVALRTAIANTFKTSILTVMKTLGYVGSSATTTSSIDGTIEAYANSKNTSNQYSSATISAAIEQAAKVLYDAVLAEKNTNLTTAQITAILQNNYAAALAKIDAMMTTTELKAAADAVIAAIAALPTTVTVADKEQYLAAEAMYEAYLENAGAKDTDITNRSLLDAYMTRLINLERTAIEAQIRILPTTVTLDNQEAIEAARAAVDAYDKAYSKYTTDPYDYDYAEVSNLSKLTTAETALSSAKLVDAAKKIAALPATITIANEADVEAARAAYDNLSDAEKAQFSTALVDKLVAAEASINEAKIKAVESLKITLSSKQGANYIRLNWTVVGDSQYADGYRVYKSTKRNSGYGSTPYFITKAGATTYKNTKGLKKGTRYYYKIRAYIEIDGVKYYSDYSNKAYRTYNHKTVK